MIKNLRQHCFQSLRTISGFSTMEHISVLDAESLEDSELIKLSERKDLAELGGGDLSGLGEEDLSGLGEVSFSGISRSKSSGAVITSCIGRYSGLVCVPSDTKNGFLNDACKQVETREVVPVASGTCTTKDLLPTKVEGQLATDAPVYFVTPNNDDVLLEDVVMFLPYC